MPGNTRTQTLNAHKQSEQGQRTPYINNPTPGSALLGRKYRNKKCVKKWFKGFYSKMVKSFNLNSILYFYLETVLDTDIVEFAKAIWNLE